eukprot:jgi/Botrbrau1/5730/Bobra.0134s0006.1
MHLPQGTVRLYSVAAPRLLVNLAWQSHHTVTGSPGCTGLSDRNNAVLRGRVHLPSLRRSGRDRAWSRAVFKSGKSLLLEMDDFETDKRPVILYDGVCNMCNSFVNLLLEQDTKGKFRLAALQSEAGKRLLARSGRQPDDISSIVLVEEDDAHIKSDAVLRIGQGLDGPVPLFSAVSAAVPKLIRDFVYDQVANNRYTFLGKRDVCRVSDAGFEDRFIYT